MEGDGGSYCAVCSSEAIDALGGRLELFFVSQERLQDLDNKVPELVVLGFEEDNQASGLGVEGAGDVEDCVVDELDDLVVADGWVLV